jgi:hypothetical protein
LSLSRVKSLSTNPGMLSARTTLKLRFSKCLRT